MLYDNVFCAFFFCLVIAGPRLTAYNHHHHHHNQHCDANSPLIARSIVVLLLLGLSFLVLGSLLQRRICRVLLTDSCSVGLTARVVRLNVVRRDPSTEEVPDTDRMPLGVVSCDSAREVYLGRRILFIGLRFYLVLFIEVRFWVRCRGSQVRSPRSIPDIIVGASLP